MVQFLLNSLFFTLTSNWEDPGFVILEAMFSKKIVLSSDCENGPIDIIKDNLNGFLFKKNDSKDFQYKFSLIFDLLKKEIITYLDKNYDELSPIELAIIYSSLYELKFSPAVPYRVVLNEAIEVAKSFGGTDGYKFINGVLNKAAAINRKHEFTAKVN